MKNRNSHCFPTYDGIALRPCPFCGAAGEIDIDEPNPKYTTQYDPRYMACCSKCNGMIEEWWDTPEEAAAAWNGRADNG